MLVEHGRFGKGQVISIEGIGNEKKAIINFNGFGIKNLLLKFAKLTKIESK
jgi:DNA helicase-2/ATP-dependent DNA helicase PcrA